MLNVTDRAPRVIALRHLESYVARSNLTPAEKRIAFSVFVVDCLVNQHTRATFDYSDLVCDARKDTGLDGVAVLVDGRVVPTVAELEAAVAAGPAQSCEIVLVQATRQVGFQENKIAKFAAGVRDLVAEQPQLECNSAIQRWREVVAAMWSKIGDGQLPRPSLTAYYASAGTWQNQQPAASAFHALERALADVSLLDSAVVKPVDIEFIARLGGNFAKRSEHLVSARHLRQLTGLPPEINAYFGTVPATDILRMITIPNTAPPSINEALFIANARGYLSNRPPVNKAMKQTLAGPQAELFPVFNLGLTIIARAVVAEGDELRLLDCQIVNGGQTAHALFESPDPVRDKNVYVSVRIVEVSDPDLVRDIIIANNSQNQVHQTDLIGILPFNTSLAHYFDAMRVAREFDAPYYATRRGTNYSEADAGTDDNLTAPHADRDLTRIGLNELIAAYLAMVLGKPHKASRSNEQLRKAVPEKVFASGQTMEPYFSAGFALMRLRQAFAIGRLPADLIPFKAYFLFLFGRRLIKLLEVPRLSDDGSARQFAKVANAILDEPEAIWTIYAEDVEIIQQAIAAHGEPALPPEVLAKSESLAEIALRFMIERG